MYSALLAIHILMAVTWVGSNVAQQIYAVRARRAGPQQFGAIIEQVGWYGNHVLAPASLVLILTGFGLAATGDWSLTEPWLIFAIAVWVASFVLGAGYLGPSSAKVGEAMAANGGAVPDDKLPLVDRLFLVSRIELVLLLLVVADMAVKPGL